MCVRGVDDLEVEPMTVLGCASDNILYIKTDIIMATPKSEAKASQSPPGGWLQYKVINSAPSTLAYWT